MRPIDEKVVCVVQSLLSLDRSTGSVSVGRSLSRDVVHRLSVVVVAENVVTGQSSTGQSRVTSAASRELSTNDQQLTCYGVTS